MQTGVPAKPCLSLFQVFYWEKLSARTLRFFHSWKSLLGRGLLPWGFLDVMTAEGCRCWICLQIVQKLLVTGLLSDSLGLTATVNAWGYLLLVCSASGHWKAPGNVFEPWHQEMSLSLDISVCKDWAMWHSHKCHHRKKVQSPWQCCCSAVSMGFHCVVTGFLSLSGVHLRGWSRKLKYSLFSLSWFLLLHVPYP